MNIRSFSFAVLLCFFTFSVLTVSAETDPVKTEKEQATTKQLSKEEFKIAYKALKVKIQDLKQAKRHAETKLEKQKINAEIKGVKEEAKALKQQVSGGVYIGSGALIVILLLILLL